MLVLARKADESIIIGDNIVVKVISIDNGVVKLGIDAPREISIVRNELIQEIKKSNIAAAKSVDESVVESLSKILSK